MRFRMPVHFRKTVSAPPVNRRVGGFTLIEVCIVIMIAGILYSMLFNMLYKNRAVETYKMQETMNRLQWGMAEYFRVFGHYPCPANPGLATGNANFGLERRVAGVCAAPGAPDVVAIGGGANQILRGAVPVRTLNAVVGCTDVANDGSFDVGAPGFILNLPASVQGVVQTALNSARQIVVANSPTPPDANNTVINRRCIDVDFARDVWGNRITYAVTTQSTLLSSIQQVGAILVQDGAGNQATANLLHFVLVSPGQDRKGGFNETGQPNPLACAGGLDAENCDNDATFRNTPWAQLGVPNDANHFDDMLAFSTYGFRQEDATWNWDTNLGAGAGELGGSPRNIVMGNPAARVALGRVTPATINALPAAKVIVGDGNVQVDGNVLVETDNINAGANVVSPGTVQANDFFYAPRYCYEPALTAACGP